MEIDRLITLIQFLFILFKHQSVNAVQQTTRLTRGIGHHVEYQGTFMGCQPIIGTVLSSATTENMTDI